MKFAIVAVFAALAIAQTLATAAVPVEQVGLEQTARAERSSAPSYGGSSYSAPPCPQNYLVSCSPRLQPVGCSQQSYGSAGAYTENRPQYILPQQYIYRH